VSDVRPLEGIKVIDLTRQMAGPYGSMVLADFGAEVIKIESKPEGDPSRNTGTYFIEGESTLFLTWNRNKKSLCVDMRDPRGLEAVKHLIADADVLMENYRPGVADQIGLGWEAMHELNPRLVYTSVNAFGSKGPLKDLPGTDPIVQATSGVMSVTGERDGGPVLVGVPIADYISSQVSVQGVLLALAGREKTGEGQYVEVSMVASLLFGFTTRMSQYLYNGKDPTRFGSAHSQVVPYQVFETADGFVVAGVWGRGWESFCEALEVPELAKDERYLTNPQRVEKRDEVTALLDPEFRKRTSDEWAERFAKHKVLFSKVNTFSDIVESEQARENEWLVEVEHPTVGKQRQIAPAVKLSDTPAQVVTPPPLLGEHSRSVLLESGMDSAAVDELLEAGVIVENQVVAK
jgi:crotonobetainyl-CoA:carnitine CoA-transferase CaiB-like acyl-CoA transferase